MVRVDTPAWAAIASMLPGIERTYHRRRRQRALGTLTPVMFALLHYQLATAALMLHTPGVNWTRAVPHLTRKGKPRRA